MPIEPIVVKKFKRGSKACEPLSAKKLDLTGDLTVTQHMAFLRGAYFLAQDMQGILEHEVLAIGRARWRTIFYAFDGERWEKRLFLENAQVENYAIDADSNFYFIAVQYRAIDHNSDDCAEFCVGCIDKQGDLLWQYSCRDEGEEMFEELHSLVNERRCGEILINEDQLLLLYAIPNTESAVKIKARDLNGRELWTREIKNAGNVLDKYALAVNDGIIEVLHGNYLERFSKDGEDLGRIVFDPSYWIEHLWRFDQKIIFSVNRGTWKERYFIFDGPDWLIE